MLHSCTHSRQTYRYTSSTGEKEYTNAAYTFSTWLADTPVCGGYKWSTPAANIPKLSQLVEEQPTGVDTINTFWDAANAMSYDARVR